MNTSHSTHGVEARPLSIAIIGAGLSGLCMGIQLKKAGIESFTLFEKGAEVGGTWRDNIYPGAACDVTAHVYSYSFEPNPDWSHLFAPQPEIQDYILKVTDKYALRKHIRFNTHITRAAFNEDTGEWCLHTQDGKTFQAQVLVSAAGGLHVPAYPDIPGIESFQGKAIHTARWDKDYNFQDKAVAVIGSGASAIQVVPAIAPMVQHLYVMQRTPSWVLMKPDIKITEKTKRLFRRFPVTQKILRRFLYWLSEITAPFLILNSPLNRLLERRGLKHIRVSVADPILRAKVTPNYRIGCKRVLISNDWYPALQRKNVTLITEGIVRISPKGIVTGNGRELPVDTLIFATGFQAPVAKAAIGITGRHGLSLDQAWANGSEAYKGVTVAGFPNMFFLMGPNTGPGHTSVLIYVETQIQYAIQAIKSLRRRGLKFIDVRKEVQDRYNRALQWRMRYTIWTSGCKSWYLTDSGKNTSLYPGFSWEYCVRTWRFNPAEYELVAQAHGAIDPALGDDSV